MDRVRKKQRRLALVGAGYSNLQALRLLSSSDAFESITLIDANPESVYCGSIPENISSQRRNSERFVAPPEWKIDLQELCETHNSGSKYDNKVRFIHGKVTDIHTNEDWVQVLKQDDGCAIRVPYEVLSIDIGSKSRCITSIPGASDFVIPTRPMTHLMDRLKEIDEELLQPQSIQQGKDNNPLTIAVVGGGASGIELALSIVGRFKPKMNKHQTLQVRLITSDQILLPEIHYARNRLKTILADRGITMMFGSAVSRVDNRALFLESGLKIPFSYCFWATGAAPRDLASVTLRQRGLEMTPDGWIQVAPTLQSPSHPNIFASGDCSSFANPLPKSGIFALQEGPILAENLKRFVRNRPLVAFEPNTKNMKFLNCGDGTAMGFAFGLVLRGEWVYQIKLAMDQRHFLNLTETTNDNRSTSHKRFDPHGKVLIHSSYADTLRDVSKIPTKQAAKMLAQINETNYQEAWAVLECMSLDADYRHKVMKDYNRLASPQRRGSEKRQKRMDRKVNESLPPPFQFLNWLMPVNREQQKQE